MSTQHTDQDTAQAEPAIDAAFLSLLQLHRGGQVLTDIVRQIATKTAIMPLLGLVQ